MSDCRFGVSPVNYPDPDPDPFKIVLKQIFLFFTPFSKMFAVHKSVIKTGEELFCLSQIYKTKKKEEKKKKRKSMKMHSQKQVSEL